MILRWALAVLHLLALPVGLGGIWARARALRRPLDSDGIRRVFVGDALWGIAAIVWIGTGLVRAFGGFEKGTAYYIGHPMFHAKMGLLGLILLLEIWPMVTLVQWRLRLRRSDRVNTTRARTLALISDIQTALAILMVFAAVALARDIRP